MAAAARPVCKRPYGKYREFVVRSRVHGLEQATISTGETAKEKAACLPVFPIVYVI
jgi:hypothetical protein